MPETRSKKRIQGENLIKMGNTGKGGIFPLSNKERVKATTEGVKRKIEGIIEENKANADAKAGIRRRDN